MIDTTPRDLTDEDPEARLWAARPSRRVLLKGAAAAALSGAGLSALAPRASAAVNRAKLDKELNFYNWSAWVGPTEVSRFSKKYGVTVHQDYYGSNDEMFAKLKAGGSSQYDVIVPSGYEVTRMMRLNMLKPLNYANIPNAKNLAPAFQDLQYDPGNKYSIPNDWGAVGIAYRTDLVKDNITSWADVWRLAPKYHRKIVFLGTPRDVIGVALLLNGYSVNSRKTSELMKARDTLLQIKPHILEITSVNQRPDLLKGDASIIMDWNEEIPSAQTDKKVGKYIKWVNPREGMVAYTDHLAIPAQAPHPYAAEVFINWLLDPKNYAEFVNYDTTAFTMKPTKYISKEVLTSPIINPPKSVLDKFQFQYDVGAATVQYDRVWTEFKSA
ncbi:MAG TPA: spermidine/putrescine ABC transporter substrate-binding protein [Chloroflexota bacterium]|nr:spermidine/putrescine ABC transporter substrate-binding protein [Chloroflexota bacterium]